MLIDNKTSKAFGRSAVFAGSIFILTGIIIIIAGGFILGAVALLFGSFMVFTYSGVELNTDTRKVRQYNKFFGVIKAGKWKSYDPFVGITLIPISTIESMASWSNRISSVKSTDYRIFFVNKEKKPAFVIKKCRTKETARNSLDELSLWLKLPVYSVKNGRRKSWKQSLN